MKEYLNNEQFNQNDEQIVTLDARVPYQPPTLTVMGKVEDLTAILFGGTPDLLAEGNIILPAQTASALQRAVVGNRIMQ
jgi:hypothetical protein